MRLTLFDLDHTLLQGDSDQLWCEFLIERGVLPREPFATRNAAMARDYAAGAASAHDFCSFYIGTLAGRSAAEWLPLREQFARTCIAPKLPASAHRLVAQHRDAGDMLVLTTATCRFLSEPSAQLLGVGHLIATECAFDADGRFNGFCAGEPNMREGKLLRLRDWLADRRIDFAACESTLYSDSINDLPLLSAVRRAVVVDPDTQLAAVASERGWARVSLR